mgnify:CR=1 FL=1|jgi:uncharacterized phage-associated protein
MIMMKVHELPDHILKIGVDYKITPLKLQRLLWYVKVWGIVAGVPLYEGEFHRERNGPINLEVYEKYKSFRNNKIVV